MNTQSRQTASVYINNLLLSRGLLRNGLPIDFAKPCEAEGGLDGTMAQVMNLVHDMILRRDRESDTLRNLSTSLTTAHQTTAAQAHQITKLEASASALERRVALSGSQERAARATLGSAESRNRALREEMTRLKASVAQVRTQCATDVRRRDGEIARLKRHLEGRRGRDVGTGAGVVDVTPGNSNNVGSRGTADVESPVDSLKQDTTEYLTRLSQGLSNENEALIGLVGGTLSTLKSLQGIPEEMVNEPKENNHVVGSGDMAGPPSYEALALSTDEVLEHLRGLLTNPSFVPIEEVEIREDEIQRLREGWEKMAVRWKEAVALMDGWKTRMVDRGDTINLNDLSDGLRLGNGIPTAQEARASPLKMRMETATYGDESDKSLEDPQRLEQGFAKPSDKASAADRALAETNANPRSSLSPRKMSRPLPYEEAADSFQEEDELSLLDFSAPNDLRTSPAQKTKSRIPLQVAPRSPMQTVQQKLERAQVEAEQARKRIEKKGQTETAAKQVTKKLKGSRRRSTLSPEELQNLMGVV